MTPVERASAQACLAGIDRAWAAKWERLPGADSALARAAAQLAALRRTLPGHARIVRQCSLALERTQFAVRTGGTDDLLAAERAVATLRATLAGPHPIAVQAEQPVTV